MATDTTGNTPLHNAADLGHRQRVRDLLASPEYEVNCTNSEDETPLHLACNKGHLSIVRTLLCEFGADVNSQDNENNTPLNKAAFGGPSFGTRKCHNLLVCTQGKLHLCEFIRFHC